jgi:hypothetical protein
VNLSVVRHLEVEMLSGRAVGSELEKDDIGTIELSYGQLEAML